ncbi:MAG: CxxxxCH/CxxCH domain-containing protein [Gemmatimonadota bacterium]
MTGKIADPAAPRRPCAARQGAPALALLLLAGLWACSDLQDDPLPPTGPAAKVHPEGWLSQAQADFHGQAIRAAGWDMAGCRTCHGADYAGGISGQPCITCHPGTPEGCDVCHGSAGQPGPPEDLRDNSATTFPGVGAHQTHLGTSVTTALVCGDCHRVPATFADAAHLDGDGRAELTFGGRAQGPEGLEPAYDLDAHACANTYCHGGGKLGNQVTPVWNQITGQACGTCHALPPPAEKGHPTLANCSLCHGGVVDADRQIIDPAKHINGQTDFF